jgi:U3 small nucleolar RNA-associated protein 14
LISSLHKQQEFEEMKKQVVNADAPREEDNTIPGWVSSSSIWAYDDTQYAQGAWGGLGVNQNRQVRSTVKIPGIEKNKRSDANKKHVVISEKRDKKAAKFQIRDVPYPYTSRAQYEASLATPLGKEWNTQTGFQKSTLPRVLHKVRFNIIQFHTFAERVYSLEWSLSLSSTLETKVSSWFVQHIEPNA